MIAQTGLAPLRGDTLARAAAFAPAYDRAALEPRILHIGPGAFFRAHQADYIDRLNALEPVWGITGLSLRSGDVPRALTPQDGLYTLLTLDETVEARIIGCLTDVITAQDERLMQVMTAPELCLVTLTVTEKAYCLGADGALDLAHPDVCADLRSPDAPTSVIGWLVHLLALRFKAGLRAPIILSCDNLPANGEKLGAAVLALASHQSQALADRIAAEVLFPSSMVDSITPATTDAVREQVSAMTGLADVWPVQREAFTDWVIEDVRHDPRMPPLDRVGAVFTRDVHGYEQAKLRLLNGAHSTMAYYGLAKGHATVAQAMRDSDLAGRLRTMMEAEIAPSLNPVAGLDLQAYIDALLERFANPALAHHLSQIAWDGSKKLPIRLMGTLADNLKAGRPVAGLCLGLASWWRFVIRQVRAGEPLIDPLTATLAARVHALPEHDAEADLSALLSLDAVVPQAINADPVFTGALDRAYAHILNVELSDFRRSSC